MEEEEFLQEHEAMEEDMEGAQPQRRRTRKARVVDPEPLNDYPGVIHVASQIFMKLNDISL